MAVRAASGSASSWASRAAAASPHALLVLRGAIRLTSAAVHRRGFVTHGLSALFLSGIGAVPAHAAEEVDEPPTFIELSDERYYVIPARELARFASKPETFEVSLKRQLEQRETAGSGNGEATLASSKTKPWRPPERPVPFGVRG